MFPAQAYDGGFDSDWADEQSAMLSLNNWIEREKAKRRRRRREEGKRSINSSEESTQDSAVSSFHQYAAVSDLGVGRAVFPTVSEAVDAATKSDDGEKLTEIEAAEEESESEGINQWAYRQARERRQRRLAAGKKDIGSQEESTFETESSESDDDESSSSEIEIVAKRQRKVEYTVDRSELGVDKLTYSRGDRVFAARAIPSGAPFDTYGGQIITKDEVATRHRSSHPTIPIDDEYSIDVWAPYSRRGHHSTVLPRRAEEDGRENAHIAIAKHNVNGRYGIVLFAKKPIATGEEVFI